MYVYTFLRTDMNVYKLLQTDFSIQVVPDRYMYISCCNHMYIYKLMQIYICIQVAADKCMLLQTGGFEFCRRLHIFNIMSEFCLKMAATLGFWLGTSPVPPLFPRLVVRLPSCVAPKTEVNVSIVIYRGIIKMPFKATFTSGNTNW
jgi:hypothetical protein